MKHTHTHTQAQGPVGAQTPSIFIFCHSLLPRLPRVFPLQAENQERDGRENSFVANHTGLEVTHHFHSNSIVKSRSPT